jgi:hypothetical protein
LMLVSSRSLSRRPLEIYSAEKRSSFTPGQIIGE